ncbi:serine/threonine-protein kinase [Mucilaginibacter lacusdianchii]|uniref:serine/threonine-protein kinase n=1 Tax=Mucilaginibacter lacusdianchii TaxID=2684211 RepID=UPI00131B997F|nr:serine/threonine-protein kinase [Mucilaginibacter sp. JXJ CY 39]
MSRVFTIVEGLENLGAMRTGGQGSVYKGRRTGQILTAVKLLPTPIHNESEDDANYRRFLNEVEKLKKVNEQPSPHVVKILSSGLTESGNFPFIEMEFIEGPDLADLLEPPKGEKVFTIKETIKVAEQLASALAHCHGVGVKHGDIKSNNVKYNVHTGNYVLLDFGLAVMSDEQRRTSIRHAGAIEFMAPEQHEGVMLLETDIYSYGVILYELLAGQVPFPLHDGGETARNAVIVSHMESAIPNFMELRSKNVPSTWTYEKQLQEMQVPEWLSGIILKCLHKDPKQRFANGVELHYAIVQGSLSASVNSAQDVNALARLTALESENKRLENLLLQYQQADADRETTEEPGGPNVSVSKPLFAAILFILVTSMAFSMYTLFFKKTTPYNAADNAAYQDTTSTMRVDTGGGVGAPATEDPQTPVNTQPVVQQPVDTADSTPKEPIKKPKPAKDSTETEKSDTTEVEPF